MASVPPAVIAVARNGEYTAVSVGRAFRAVLDHLSPPLPSLIGRGDRVLVKVNMGCSGFRAPHIRHTTHPLVAEAIIGALIDCGAKVSFGDDVSRAGRYCGAIHESTGMREVSRRTGARLIDFVKAGAREVRSGLRFPRSYLVTNSYFDADIVVNAANCRSHVGIGLSGAIKNMFGCVVGRRKAQIHNYFPNAEAFGRTIADIYRTIPAHISFLDVTSVAEAAGITYSVRPVGLIFGGVDAVALDTVAAHAIGYQALSVWPTHYAGRFGVGCSRMSDIEIRGCDWESFEAPALEYPYVPPIRRDGPYEWITNRVNNTWLRPRPVIRQEACNGCGDCFERCPVRCIEESAGGKFVVKLADCADCACCLKTCEAGAIRLEFVGAARVVRRVLRQSLAVSQPESDRVGRDVGVCTK